MAEMTQHHRTGLERQKRIEFYRAKFAEHKSITDAELEALLPQWKEECDAMIAAWEAEIAAAVSIV